MPPQLIPKSLELNKICRACLSEKGDMRPLYGSCLDDMLRCVAQVAVQPGDGLPELMCLQCVLQVSRAFRFKQQCETSDQTLRDFLAQNAIIQVPEVEHNEEIAIINGPEKTMESVMSYVQTLEDIVKEEQLVVPQEAQLPTSEVEVAQRQFCDTTEIVLCEETVEICGFPSESSTLPLMPEMILTDDSAARTEMFETFTYEDSGTNTKDEKDSPKLIDFHESISFQCHICDKSFPKRGMWRRHLKIHDPVKPHICNECGMSFTESSNLKKHQKKHTGELRNVVGKPNLCSVCGKGFKWASSLSKHMNHHTKKKILNCPHCPKYYVESRSLRIHLRTHTGEKPYVCDICDKGFTQMCNLEKHLRVHTGEKPYLCPMCGKGFSQSGYVAVHLRSHTGEKPFSCTECGKSFAGSNTLAIHKKIHTGEKPFACGVCKKAFGRKESLAVHSRTHTGEKSYVCSVCNRGFTCPSQLTIHFRTHTGEKPYFCKLCPKKFFSCNSLKAHVKTHEKKKQETFTSEEQNLHQYADQQGENTIMILQEMDHDQIKSEFPILD